MLLDNFTKEEKTTVLEVDEYGSVYFVKDVQLIPEGVKIESVRVSHVEPLRLMPRVLFHIIRSVCSDDSKLARWTREWKVPWRINLTRVNGPIIQPYTNRPDAIKAEITWLWTQSLTSVWVYRKENTKCRQRWIESLKKSLGSLLSRFTSCSKKP